MLCPYGERKMAQIQKVFDGGEKALVGPNPSPPRHLGALKEDFWWFWWCRGWVCFKHVANVWLELCLNPLGHRSTAWESLANVQRDGERVFTSLACSYMLWCWMKRCLNMERTWGFWLHQRHPRYFDFVFPSFWGWWVHPAAAVATAANKQSEVKWLFNFEKTFISWIMTLFQTLLRLGLAPHSLKEQEKILTNVSDKVVLHSHYWVRET